MNLHVREYVSLRKKMAKFNEALKKFIVKTFQSFLLNWFSIQA